MTVTRATSPPAYIYELKKSLNVLDRSQAEEGEVQFDCRLHLVLCKKQSWWFCHLLLFCLAGSMCAGRPRFLGFVHPEEDRKVRVRFRGITDSLLHQVFSSTLWMKRISNSICRPCGCKSKSRFNHPVTYRVPVEKIFCSQQTEACWNSAHSTGL